MMAQDWITMRTWLAKDPKVIAMADRLADDPGFRSWLFGECNESAQDMVGHKVITAIVVTGLLQVWGTVRIDGRRPKDVAWSKFQINMYAVTNGVTCHVFGCDMSHDDLVVTNATRSTLDEISGVTGFGDAMMCVGWVDEPWGGLPVVVFPKFFLRNYDTEERRRENDRDRQRRSREKRKAERHALSRDTSRQLSHKGKESKEHKSKEEEERVPSAPLSASADPSLDISTNGHMGPSGDVLLHAWNEAVSTTARCQSISGKRKVALTNRNRDAFFREHWLEAINKIADSPFCNGHNERGWVATIDWFLKPDTVLKVVEGTYDGREPAAVGRKLDYESLFGENAK